MKNAITHSIALVTACIWPTLVQAQDTYKSPSDFAGGTGVSGLWILSNICYAGMRAQSHPSSGWRITSFIFGFPGTLVSYFAVKEGSDQAYGVKIPRK